jgi:hypothetical protein
MVLAKSVAGIKHILNTVPHLAGISTVTIAKYGKIPRVEDLCSEKLVTRLLPEFVSLKNLFSLFFSVLLITLLRFLKE